MRDLLPLPVCLLPVGSLPPKAPLLLIIIIIICTELNWFIAKIIARAD
jgi:hypothetical protein